MSVRSFVGWLDEWVFCLTKFPKGWDVTSPCSYRSPCLYLFLSRHTSLFLPRQSHFLFRFSPDCIVKIELVFIFDEIEWNRYQNIR